MSQWELRGKGDVVEDANTASLVVVAPGSQDRNDDAVLLSPQTGLIVRVLFELALTIASTRRAGILGRERVFHPNLRLIFLKLL
jgi:hypothetical protein